MFDKILIADDNNKMREMLMELLGELTNSLIEAENGVEAVQKSKQFNPGLIIMDIEMPKMDGITAAKEILKHDENAKILFLTSFADELHRRKVLEFNGSGIFSKEKLLELKDYLFSGNLI